MAQLYVCKKGSIRFTYVNVFSYHHSLRFMLNHFSFILTIMKKTKLEICSIYKGRLTVSHIQHVLILTLRFYIIPFYPKQWHSPAYSISKHNTQHSSFGIEQKPFIYYRSNSLIFQVKNITIWVHFLQVSTCNYSTGRKQKFS